MSVRRLVIPALIVTAALVIAWLQPAPGEAPSAGRQEHEREESSPSPIANEPEGSGRTADRQLAPRDTVTPDIAVVGRLVRGGVPLPGVSVQVLRVVNSRETSPLTEIVTDDSGGIAIEELAAVEFRLVPRGTAIPHGFESPTFRARAHGQLDLGDVRVPQGSRVRGRIVSEDGVPIAAALVFVGRRPQFGSVSFRRDITDLNSPELPPHTVSDDAGLFAIENLCPGQQQALVESNEHEDGGRWFELADGADHDLGDVRLRPGGEVRGIVLEAAGGPVANALVAPQDDGWEPPRMRKATRTATDGTFTLRCLEGSSGVLHAYAAGYARAERRLTDGDQDVVLLLRRELMLRGRVVGPRATSARISVQKAISETGAFEALANPAPVGRDGAFEIGGLEPRDYYVQAVIAGFGRSASVRCALGPDTAPLELTIVHDGFVTVVVRDDVGQPIASAELRRNKSREGLIAGLPEHASVDDLPTESRRWISRMPVLGVTDAAGRATLAIPRDQAVSLDATHVDHLHTCSSFRERPEHIEIIMRRAGRLVGVVDDATDARHVAMGVTARSTSGWAEGPLDALGHFELAGLEPGSYEVTLWRKDATKETSFLIASHVPLPPDPVPMIGAGVDARSTCTVDVRPGETSQVDLVVHPLGVIHGRVLSAGHPVASAHVLAVSPEDTPGSLRFETGATWDDEDVADRGPSTTTAPDGSFRFFYLHPGEWHLRARHPDSAVTTEPVLVNVPRTGMTVQQDLALGNATVRGTLDPREVAERYRDRLRVMLFRAEGAEVDPFSGGGFPVAWQLKAIKLDRSSAFEFRYLPGGDWVLRVVTGDDDVLLTRRVTTAPGQLVDLDVLTLPRTVTAEVRCDVPPLPTDEDEVRRWYAAWVRAIDGDRPAVFVRVAAVGDGVIALGELAPGHYEVELFLADPPFSHTYGTPGESTGDKWRITVGSDGGVEPAVLRR